MGRLATVSAFLVAGALALPPAWCSMLLPASCCQCCEGCRLSGGECCQDEGDESPAENPCTCGKEPLKQADKVVLGILPLPALATAASEPPIAAAPCDTYVVRDLQRLLCRWRC